MSRRLQLRVQFVFLCSIVCQAVAPLLLEIFKHTKGRHLVRRDASTFLVEPRPAGEADEMPYMRGRPIKRRRGMQRD